MTPAAAIPAEGLPALIDRAARALGEARTSAEVLEARDLAAGAYDAAKSAERMARRMKAHGDMMGRVHRAQADALLIEARAKMLLADEYDAAQERGEVGQRSGRPSKVVADDNDFRPATAADLGLRRPLVSLGRPEARMTLATRSVREGA